MEILAYHQMGDLALLRFSNPVWHEDEYADELVSGIRVSKGFSQSCTFSSQLPARGSFVYALGNALAYGVSVSQGLVTTPIHRIQQPLRIRHDPNRLPDQQRKFRRPAI